MIIAAVDIETKDPNLQELGSGAIRNDGYVIGVGIYCPELHINDFFRPDDQQIKRVLDDENISKVFHNGVYDIDWLVNNLHYKINGKCEDTMTRETLLDAYAPSYSLDNCCTRRGVKGKNKEDTIDLWWLEHKKHDDKGPAIKNLDKIPFHIVGRYCKQDCKATYDLYMAQQPLLEEQGLTFANDIECRLYPYITQMHANGFRINENSRLGLYVKLNTQYNIGMAELAHKYNIPDLSLNRAVHLKQIFDAEGIPVTYTEKMNPSFTSDVLADIENPVAEKIHQLRATDKLIGSFLNGAFVRGQHNGRLYSTFYPSKRDNGGTVTGRWSSQNVNLQQIPARDDKHGTEIRSLFIPEEGCYLGAFDYKQIEYRIFIHYASGQGAKEAQQSFVINPDIDYHDMAVELLHWGFMGKLGRKIAKNFNFGAIYGLGYRSFARKYKKLLIQAFHVKDDEVEELAKTLMNEYYTKLPFVKPTILSIENVASKRGYVRTLANRRQRLNDPDKVYALVNYLVQGSAADVLKKGIVDAWDAGVFNVLIPHAAVHDENVFSIPRTREGYEACEELYRCMANAYKLHVPLGVDKEIGLDWGHCTGETYDKFRQEVGYGNV